MEFLLRARVAIDARPAVDPVAREIVAATSKLERLAGSPVCPGATARRARAAQRRGRVGAPTGLRRRALDRCAVGDGAGATRRHAVRRVVPRCGGTRTRRATRRRFRRARSGEGHAVASGREPAWLGAIRRTRARHADPGLRARRTRSRRSRHRVVHGAHGVALRRAAWSGRGRLRLRLTPDRRDPRRPAPGRIRSPTRRGRSACSARNRMGGSGSAVPIRRVCRIAGTRRRGTLVMVVGRGQVPARGRRAAHCVRRHHESDAGN